MFLKLYFYVMYFYMAIYLRVSFEITNPYNCEYFLFVFVVSLMMATY
jgi:hypothetical protein